MGQDGQDGQDAEGGGQDRVEVRPTMGEKDEIKVTKYTSTLCEGGHDMWKLEDCPVKTRECHSFSSTCPYAPLHISPFLSLKV